MEDALLLSRSWLFLTAPACVIGLGLIVASVLFLLRTIRVPEFARLPLVAEQDVDLADAGPLTFVIDNPRFSNVQASTFKPFALAVSLENAAGRVVTCRQGPHARERPGHEPHARSTSPAWRRSNRAAIACAWPGSPPTSTAPDSLPRDRAADGRN